MILRQRRTDDDPALLAIWEDAVRASHTFLVEGDVEAIRPDVAAALAGVEVWVALIDHQPAGFMGLDGTKVEMLFISPAHKGRGLGTGLLNHARSLHQGETLRVDVNEQNLDAVAFYLAWGFRQFARSEKDAAGRPYPILHLRWCP